MPTYDLTLTMLSPVHIGTGEELSPGEYVVAEAKDAGGQDVYCLHAIDMPRFLTEMGPALRRDFDQAVAASSITMLRKLLAKNVDLDRHTAWRAWTSAEVFGLYRRGLDRASAELAVHPITRTSLDARPYLPGSSIKGAIRTAVLQAILDASPGRAEALARNAGRGGQREAQALEGQALDYVDCRSRPEIRADPFRAVRITDCALDAESTCVDPVELRSLKAATRRSSDPSGIHLFYEMTFSALDDETIRARGQLAIDDRLAKTRTRGARGWDFEHCVSRPIAAEEILRACRDFYVPRLRQEAERFGSLSAHIQAAYNKLLALAGKLNDQEAVIRLGRFSHVECVTLAPPLRRAPGGSSRGLAAGTLPMGWIKLALRPAET